MLTAEQRTARRSMIGSSDAAAVLGLDPYKTAWEVWAEKTGQLRDFAGNAATDRGTLLEPVLIEYATRELIEQRGSNVIALPGVMLTSADGLLCVNFDAVVMDDDGEPIGHIEAKTSSNPDEWGEVWSDAVPQRVIVQCHLAMHVGGPKFRTAWVPVLLPGYRSLDFRMYVVERNDGLADAVAEKCRDFMRTYVIPGIEPPQDTPPPIEVLKRLTRSHKPVEVPREAVERWLVARAAAAQARADAKPLEDAEDLAKRELIHAMKDGDGAMLDGELVATYCEIHRRAIAATTYRALKLAKAGKGER